MDSQEIAPYKPLPPQRWGFLPTNQFWYHAMLTPISLIFWAGAAVFFTFFDLFALVWWQQSLAWMVFWWVWAGLVERYVRRHLARRRLLALAGPRTDARTGTREDVKLLGILALLGAARGVGSWERRQARVAAGEMPRPAPEADDRRPGDPHERVG